MSFHVGQKVVCVDDSPTDRTGERELTRGQIYTIRWAGRYADDVNQMLYGVRLAEIDRGADEWRPDLIDIPFFAHRFRPIVEDRKSVSFTIGADPESERWDGRRKKARERA